LAGDCVMDDHYCPSVFSLQPKHLSSYQNTMIILECSMLNDQ
jgi:hypothetical protein